MKNVSRIALMAALALAVAVVATPNYAADVTVGQFLVEIAKVKNLNAADPNAAAAALKVPAANLSKPLTEGDVAGIAKALGLNVKTSNPQASFGSKQVSTFLSAFGPELGRQTAPNTPQGVHPPPGGWKKGHVSHPEPL